MADTAYHRCLESMYRLHRFGIKLGLDTITQMLDALGNPHRQFQSIHIAGTNGKGSVAAMLSTILDMAGYKVGRYTSPHLERFNERICIGTRPIEDEDVLAACKRVQGVTDTPRQPTFFEYTTAMAFSEFARHKVQWSIIETGMGGRLDATNIIDPALTIITNISMEHQAYLGKTLAAIAGEKAGIIKAKAPIITGVRQKRARTVVLDRAAAQGSPAYCLGSDFRTRRMAGEQFNYYGISSKWNNLSTPLHGDYQLDNAALALAACDILTASGRITLTDQHIRDGLANTSWPGRLEVVSTSPLVILDGAHNIMAARALGRYLTQEFANRRVTLVIGMMDDKAHGSILKYLAAPCQRIVVTQANIDHAIPTAQLRKHALTVCGHVEAKANVVEALEHAIVTSGPEDVVCVAGSLYLVGEAKTSLAKLDAESKIKLI